MSKDKNAEKINVENKNGAYVENERKWQEKPSSPSPLLIDPRLHPHFCFRHFYLSTFCPFDQSRISRFLLGENAVNEDFNDAHRNFSNTVPLSILLVTTEIP
jgi:hypothetical protein